MKKDIEWAKNRIKNTLKIEALNDREVGFKIAMKEALELIDQLDRARSIVAGIDSGRVHVKNLGETFEVVSVEGLSVPKQELPVIPQWVADNIESNKKVGTRLNVAMSEFPELKLEKELGIDENECNELYARAWLDGYTVEEQQKYYVDLGDVAYVAKWSGDDQVYFYTDSISGSDEFELHLTEQEIKNYDERFWPFAKPVEEVG